MDPQKPAHDCQAAKAQDVWSCRQTQPLGEGGTTMLALMLMNERKMSVKGRTGTGIENGPNGKEQPMEEDAFYSKQQLRQNGAASNHLH